jgi:alpha-L-fucosidase
MRLLVVPSLLLACSIAGASPANPVALTNTVTSATLAAVSPSPSPTPSSTPTVAEETKEQRDARMGWWRDAKFGMFIHWGLYSVLGGVYGKNKGMDAWIMNGKLGAGIPVAEYKTIAGRFNPVKFNADEWVSLAKEAGQKYMVITTKHHEGFAMFGSKVDGFNIVDGAPFKRDPVKELAEACRRQNMKLGFYYSQSQDWTHPGGDCKFGRWDKAQEGSMDDYVDRVAMPHVKELLSNYGEFPSVLWWDTGDAMSPSNAAKLKGLLALKPGIISNNRLGGGVRGDMETPEQYIPVLGYPGRDWETCMTINDCWGYVASDTHWKSTAELLRKLAEVNGKGGNFLLNVGPDAEGKIPAPCAERLRQIGAWLKTNGESIYGTTAGPFWYLSWGYASRKGQTLYLHVFDWPKDGLLRVPMHNPATKAWLLAKPDAPLQVEKGERGLVVHVPAAAPDPIDSVVALSFEGDTVVPDPPSLKKPCRASSVRNGSLADNAVSGTTKVWDAEENARSAWLEIDLGAPTPVSAIAFSDPGRPWFQRKQSFELQYKEGDAWKTIVTGETAGHGYNGTFPPVTARVFRLNITKAQDSPGAAQLFLFSPE